MTSSRADGSVRKVKHGTYHKTIKVGNRNRHFVVHVPRGYRNETLPLVLILHGGLGNELTVRFNTRMTGKSDEDKFFAVYPNGTGRDWTHLLTWNAGTCCGRASERNVDDVAFIRALLDLLEKNYKVDPDRIYVAGMSNGGMMTYRLGRELSDRIAAIAPVCGCMFDTSGRADCPVSVIAFHGTDDPIIRYDGGEGSLLGYKVHALPVAAAMRFWVRSDNCSKVPVREETGNILKETYSNGDSGTEVCLYTIGGGKHAWPGARLGYPPWSRPTRELSATDAICDFFWKHPKRGHQ